MRISIAESEAQIKGTKIEWNRIKIEIIDEKAKQYRRDVRTVRLKMQRGENKKAKGGKN
jgi:hypothetical protein